MAVESIQHTAMTGDQIAEILDAYASFDRRHTQVTKLCKHISNDRIAQQSSERNLYS